MAWRDDVIKMLRVDRRELLSQIESLESGSVRLHQVRDGVSTDTTDDSLSRMKVSLAEIEHFLADAGVSYDDE